eukprot:1139200-Pelagomonas_calceolata.AAC.4
MQRPSMLSVQCSVAGMDPYASTPEGVSMQQAQENQKRISLTNCECTCVRVNMLELALRMGPALLVCASDALVVLSLKVETAAASHTHD